MNKPQRIGLTASIILVAVGIIFFNYRDYLCNPWTRDGQVRAQVIQVTPRVSGPIVNLPVQDNQFVKAGELLFEIDPRTFEAAVHQAEAVLQQARVNVDEARDEMNRARKIRRKDKGALSEQDFISRKNTLRAAHATVLAGESALRNAELNLEFTRIRASVAGYITNLNLRLGSQVVENQPVLALVDSDSFWVHGFFNENSIEGIHDGNEAIVRLKTYPDKPLQGKVDSIGWGIAQKDGSTSYNLLPEINATFEWIRLAQRIPVRIHLTNVPDDVRLRVGTTATVLVLTGTGDNENKSSAVVLQ